MMASAKRVSREAFDDLCKQIQYWNENRLELFEISMPNENLEFEGIMRFYFQNDGPGKGPETEKVATKCIRVSNSATTESVIKALVQKFRPDMRMLASQSYALYEVHANQDERRLETNENPLLVQLGWSRDDRDGRFLLRSEQDSKSAQKMDKKGQKKRLSRRKKSKKERSEVEISRDEEDGVNLGRIARSLYNIMPESRFTRSISIKNRHNLLSRHSPDKLLRKDNIGNEFKIFADFVLPDVPSISLLVSEKDTAAQVVKSALDRYSLREDSTKFGLVQVTVPSLGSEPHLNVEMNERMLGDNEHPCQVFTDWASGSHRGTSMQFQLRRRSTFLQNERDSQSRSMSPEDDPSVPALVEIFQGAQSPPQSPRRFELSLESTEIGSNVALLDQNYICLTSSGIKPRHCVISCTNQIFTISPLDKTALITVNGKYIKEPIFLPHNAEIKLGEREMFRFFAPVENKAFTSSMHTLPSHRPGSSRGVVSPARQERRSSLTDTRTENISKAFSVEDFCSPGFTSSHFADGRLKDRAFSEHNLKVDDQSSSGYGSGRVQRKFSEPNVMAEDGSYLTGSRHNYGGSDSQFGTFPSSNKKRHMSGVGDKGHIDEEVELEWVLPASLSFYQAQENRILQLMISEVNGYLLTFKLAPACGLYMVLKWHLSPDVQLSASTERLKGLNLTIKNIVMLFKKSIKESRTIAGALAFWVANCSEFLHLISRDPQLSAISVEFEASLTQVIHTAFKAFIFCMTRDLSRFLPAFYDESPEADSEEGYISGGDSTTSAGTGKEMDINRSPPHTSRPTSLTGMYWSVTGSKVRRRGRPTIGDVLTILSSTVSLLKRCYVNATLSIMMFSQLFHYISAKLFNKLVTDNKLCTRAIAQKMLKRLNRIKDWAEKEGMELPAQEHLCLITQAISLLLSVKKIPEEAQLVYRTCSKLNSIQTHTLLHFCSLSDSEQSVNKNFTEQLVLLAQTRTDQLLTREGVEITLEEEASPDLSITIPQKGYHTDSLRGIPSGLHDYLEPMISSGLCKLTIANEENPQGIWVPVTREKMVSPVYSETHPLGLSKAPPSFQSVQEVLMIEVTIKKEGHSLGISIIGGKNSAMHGDIGIFVKSMVEGGAAHLNGKIQPGDEIIAVDGQRLNWCTQEEAAQILRATGKVVTLTVAKQTAILLGLSHLIGQPSPRYTRKIDKVGDSSLYNRKAARKQKREQRERQQLERMQQRDPPRDFKLERRKPPIDRSHHPRAQDAYPLHGMPPADSLLPPHSNPQFAKWIREQHSLYYSEFGQTGSEIDLQSSMSSLANIPERDHPVSTEMSFFDSSNHYNYEREERGHYRPASPPQRDSSSTRMVEQQYTNYGSSIGIDQSDSELHNKFNELMKAEPEHRFPSIPKPRLHSTSTSAPYKDDFSLLGSQFTIESQPFSQQQISSQQQHQHLDKLSMDVMQHTQLSGTSFQGITSLIPNTTGGEAHLDRKGLKKLEAELKMDMDEIDLEKQRIQFMLHEERRQKELQELANTQSINLLSEDEEDIGDQDEPLPQEQMRQELESLEEMVSAQRKKYREIKFSREREELKLKEIEMKFREQEMKSSTFVLNSGDQKRWQLDQKRLLRELERLKNEQSDTIQKIQNSERRAKTKLKAYETQANELKQQLNMSCTPPAPSPSLGLKNGYETYDTVPSKLTSEYKKGSSIAKSYQDVELHDASRIQSNSSGASEMKWTDTPTSSRAFLGTNAPTMSIDSIFEPPDLAKETMMTISNSCLTDPTQDDPRWQVYRSNTRENNNLYPIDSRATLDSEDSFERGRSEAVSFHGGFRAVSMDHLEGSQSVPSREVFNPEKRNDRLPIRRGSSFNVPIHSTEKKDKEGRITPTKAPIYAIPERSEPAPQPTYDVPTSARQHHQQTMFMQAQPTHNQPTGRHYSRNARSRGVQYTKVLLQPTTTDSTHTGQTSNPSKRGTDIADNSSIATPDVVPTLYTSPQSTHIPTNPRQHPPGERNHSPSSMTSSFLPSPQPANPYYAVPVPVQTDRLHPPMNTSPTSQLSISTERVPQIPAGLELTKTQQQHVQSTPQSLRHVQENATNGTDSPMIYDHLKNHSAPSTRPNSASSSRTVVYNVPTAAQKNLQATSPSYEGVTTRQGDSTHGSRTNNPVYTKQKFNSGHRYGISRPGMGHSYSRSRPDSFQHQPVGLDKVKSFMDRAYKNPNGGHHPERVQRQQTEL